MESISFEKKFNNSSWVLKFIDNKEKIDDEYSYINYYGIKTIVNVRDCKILFASVIKKNGVYHADELIFNDKLELSEICVCEDINNHTKKTHINPQYYINNKIINRFVDISRNDLLLKRSDDNQIDDLVKGFYANPLNLPTLIIGYFNEFSEVNISDLIESIS
jgi:hypothetical protein